MEYKNQQLLIEIEVSARELNPIDSHGYCLISTGAVCRTAPQGDSTEGGASE